ncbi:unnamed protein product [Peronospora belbahrii]|uniref:Uncharacterized protein n=1 Tax=Peronospora belbahrii TaxID=622444 RepID=A0ABN8D3K3_9STRA|nr:unnamed protein product [Peronospora belbahrii]
MTHVSISNGPTVRHKRLRLHSLDVMTPMLHSYQTHKWTGPWTVLVLDTNVNNTHKQMMNNENNTTNIANRVTVTL